MRLLTLWVGKLIYGLLKLLGRRGSALPGLIVERIYPSFLAKSLASLPQGVIVVTGTNGKTTSTKMLAHILNGKSKVLTNPTGSNFVRGIISAIVHHSCFSGALPYDIAVFELDEAYAVRFVDLFKPRVVIVTNIMRDQMDRFGEIDTTAKLIKKVVKNTTDFVVLNRDDARVASLAQATKKPVFYFGVAPNLRQLYRNDDELHEDATTLKASNLPAMAELLEILDGGRIVLSLNTRPTTIKMTASSSFNYQNAVAVCAAALALGIDVEDIVARLQEVKPAFGRGEMINIGNKKVVLQLVKNPGGFRHALHSLSTKEVDNFMIAINDDYADGRDVSWLWDVDFKESFKASKNCRIYTSGTRAVDMALRLKYDDIEAKVVEPALEACLNLALAKTKNRKTLLIYTTYTAMLALRKILAKNNEVEVI